MKQILVKVETDGTIEIEAVGFKGSACTQATAAIEKALGVAGKRAKKPEFFQDNQQQAKVGQ